MGQEQSSNGYNSKSGPESSKPARSNDDLDEWKLLAGACAIGAGLIAWSFLQQLDDRHNCDRYPPEEPDNIRLQAGGCVDAKVRYVKPNEESKVLILRGIMISTKAKDLKGKLETKFGIPENKIQVYLEVGEHGLLEMPDEATLMDLGITDDISLVVRDGSQRYGWLS